MPIRTAIPTYVSIAGSSGPNSGDPDMNPAILSRYYEKMAGETAIETNIATIVAIANKSTQPGKGLALGMTRGIWAAKKAMIIGTITRMNTQSIMPSMPGTINAVITMISSMSMSMTSSTTTATATENH